jgi:hypothetical protein
MSRTASTSTTKNRPSPLSSKSFARYEPPVSSSPSSQPNVRNRASTVQSPVTVKPPRRDTLSEDVFEKKNEDDEEPVSPSIAKSTSLPDKFDELPIELQSLTDRFVESLKAKVYNEPPTIDQLSELFQDFYIQAASRIGTHISTLLSRLNREPSPSRPATRTRQGKDQSSDSLAPPTGTGASQQMLTASEVTEKRKARKLLEYKRILLEEAVEKRVCEKIYDKIWRHKTTLDEVRDEKLRSKTAALALVGIGLKDLGIEADKDSSKTLEDVQESLAPAREDLARMTDERCPLGKLQHLTTAHKTIVETLYSIHPSSASADDILPTLIYTLITSPVEGINIISNLYFIQRFRTATKIDGEAAYCMTNLEAAISFLENVDLASLRADEVPEGPPKTTGSDAASLHEKPEPFPTLPLPAASPSKLSHAEATPNDEDLSTPTTSSRDILSDMNRPATRHTRTLSDILHPITNAPEAVRSTAEASLQNISSTLDNSFKFLFGKLQQQQAQAPRSDVVVPKTLDEARQLVSRPLTPDEEGVISETSSIGEGSNTSTPPQKLSTTEDKVLNLFGGRRRAGSNLLRDRSADSQRSNASASSNPAKKVLFAATGSAEALPTMTTIKPPPQSTSNASSGNPLDTVKTFGANLNPINHLASFGGAFRSFSRAGASASPSSTTPPTQLAAAPSPSSSKPVKAASVSSSSSKEISLRPPSKNELFLIKSLPPNQRFLDAEAGDLTVREVGVLLEEFKRVSSVLAGLRVLGEEDAEDPADAADTEKGIGDEGGRENTGDGEEEVKRVETAVRRESSGEGKES